MALAHSLNFLSCFGYVDMGFALVAVDYHPSARAVVAGELYFFYSESAVERLWRSPLSLFECSHDDLCCQELQWKKGSSHQEAPF